MSCHISVQHQKHLSQIAWQCELQNAVMLAVCDLTQRDELPNPIACVTGDGAETYAAVGIEDNLSESETA